MWIFEKNFSEMLEEKIHAGSEVAVLYDGSRLPGRDKRHGMRAWDIFAEFKFNDRAKVHKQKLYGPEFVEGEEIMGTRIFIPFGTKKITIWFKHWGYYSGYSYDSDYGKNYEEAVYPPAENSIEFKKDHSEIVHGRLEKGGKFRVFYRQKRLGKANVSTVTKFSEKSEILYTHALVGPEGGYLVTSYDVPDDAEEVIMWFYTGEGDERKYDGNYRQSYKFPLSS